MGIERVALLKWGVEDIRLFYENDLRFLEQFGLMKVLLSWIREFVDIDESAEDDRHADVACAASRSKGSSRHGDDARHGFRRHRESSRLPVDDRHRARDRDGLRPAAPRAGATARAVG